MPERAVLAIAVVDEDIVARHRVQRIEKIQVPTIHGAGRGLIGDVVAGVYDCAVTRRHHVPTPCKEVLVRASAVPCKIEVCPYADCIVSKLLVPPAAVWLVRIMSRHDEEWPESGKTSSVLG